MESYKKSFKLGDKEITLESGKVARQATGAVLEYISAIFPEVYLD